MRASTNARMFSRPFGLLALALATTACEAEDPFDFEGPRSCEIADQNEWLYNTMHEVYLWNGDLPDVDPTTYESPSALMSALRHSPPDRWSRVSDKVTTKALFNEGKVVAMGFKTRREDDGVYIALVEPGSMAEASGLRRGDRLLAINGVEIDVIDEMNLWGEIYGPNEPGVEIALEVEAEGEPSTVHIVRDWFELTTVSHVDVIPVGDRRVGYLYFSTFVATSDAELETAFARFRDEQVTDVVIDLRYNGGGLISTARHLTDLLVAGWNEGINYQVHYNDHLAELDDARPLRATPSSLRSLDHVVFIGTGATASASELVINTVKPYVKVSLVGTTTVGKPVGSRFLEFCDKIAAPITFELLNAKGEGRYYEGFEPDCKAADDLAHQLGDAEEGLLAQALSRIEGDACRTPASDEGEEARTRPGLTSRATRPVPLLFPGLEELRGLF